MFLYTIMVGTFDADAGTPDDSEQFTGWMERQGDSIRATLAIKGMSSKCKVTLYVLHKNREDTGDGTPVGSSAATTTTDDQELTTEVSGLKELVRIKVVCETTETSVNKTDHCRVQVLAPQWQWSGA